VTRHGKLPAPGNRQIDLEAVAAAADRFEITTVTDNRDTGGFTPWNSFMHLDAEGLLQALVGNRLNALVVLRAAGFKPPVAANALTDPKAARQLAKAADHWLDRHKTASGVAVAFATLAADILRDWCTIITPQDDTWEREAARVRVLGVGATMGFVRRDAKKIWRAARDAEQARLERESKSTGGKQGGKTSGRSRRDKARPKKEEFWKLDAKSKLSAARAAQKHGLSESTVRRWRKEKRPPRGKLRGG
jgi:hypothetical protein